MIRMMMRKAFIESGSHRVSRLTPRGRGGQDKAVPARTLRGLQGAPMAIPPWPSILDALTLLLYVATVALARDHLI
jgi:hypothetical protein